MYNEKDLAERIETVTGYNVTLAPIVNVDSIPPNIRLPLVSVGHLQIIPDKKGDLYTTPYLELENQEILISEISYVCPNSQWASVRQNIKLAYTNWSPFPDDANFSSVFFIKAEKKAPSGDRVVWSEIIGLIMPRIT